MMKWSLQKMASSMATLFEKENSKIDIDSFDKIFEREYKGIMLMKVKIT